MSEDLVITPIPALCTILVKAEREKGSPLSKQEVEDIADKCACMALPVEAAKQLEESRGYGDIDPGNSWEEWQSFREWFYHAQQDE